MTSGTTARKGVRLTTAIIGVGNLGSAVARHLVSRRRARRPGGVGRSACKGAGGRAGPECERRLGRRRDRGRRRRRARSLARPDQAAGARPDQSARGQGRRRPVQPDRLRRERADDPDAARRTVVRLGGRRPSSRPARTTSRRSGHSAPTSSRPPNTTSRGSFCSTPPTTMSRRPPPERLISAAGFEPLKVGGVSDAGRIEGPDGDLQGRILDLDQARATVATEGVRA